MGRFSHTVREVCDADHTIGSYTFRFADIAALNYSTREEALAHFDAHSGDEGAPGLLGMLGMGAPKAPSPAVQQAQEEARREAREAITAKALVQLAGSDRWFRIHPDDFHGLKSAWEAWLDEFGGGA